MTTATLTRPETRLRCHLKLCKGCGLVKVARADPQFTDFPLAGRVKSGALTWKARCRTCHSADRAERKRQERLESGEFRFVPLPAGPLAEAIRRQARRQERDVESLAEDLGITARRVLEWETPGATTQFATADRVVTAGEWLWWDVWPADRFPEVAERLEYADMGPSPVHVGRG